MTRSQTFLAAAVLAAGGQSVEAQTSLDLEAIFASPSISGPSPMGVQISPDGQRVTLLRGKDSDPDRYDLWEYRIDSGELRRLVDADDVVPEEGALSADEEALRERMRIVGVSGIIDYSWSDDGNRLLFPLDGDAYLVTLGGDGEQEIRQLLDTEHFETDLKLSPDNQRLSFVREQDLYVLDIESGEETRLTQDGGGPIRNGQAEFVAQEEMRRYTGYWWSPNGRYVAYTRVDETPVDEIERFEIGAEDIEVIRQRYPRAGTDNARIQLFVHDLQTGERREMDLGDEQDIYIYRVDWFPDSAHLAVQRQPRLLQSLDLLKFDITSGRAETLLTETSPIWVELQDDLTFVGDSGEFVWTSGRSGHQHLYLYSADGELIRPLTAGDRSVAGSRGRSVLGVSADKREVYFTATAEHALQRHFYAQSLDTDTPQQWRQITQGEGSHSVALSRDASVFVTTFSNPDQPPQVSLHGIDGERLAWITENALDASHPYAPFLANHISPEFSQLTAEDGQALNYQVLKPAGFDPTQQYPVLLYVYGGPGGQQVQRSWMSTVDLWLQSMAQRGYVVFTLDNRGTGNRGRAFDAPLYLNMGTLEVRDQMVGVEWLKQQSWVDDERIGVFGWSYGGYMALMMLMQQPGEFAAGVSGAPVTDWTLYDTYYTERFMQRPQDNPGGYEAGNVMSYADQLADPLLVIHGMADDNVLFTHSTKLFADLQAKNLPFEMMTYPGAKHSLIRIRGTGQHSLGATQQFFDRYLQP
jgi:dipeptidyl-peptidase-4